MLEYPEGSEENVQTEWNLTTFLVVQKEMKEVRNVLNLITRKMRRISKCTTVLYPLKLDDFSYSFSKSSFEDFAAFYSGEKGF